MCHFPHVERLHLVEYQELSTALVTKESVRLDETFRERWRSRPTATSGGALLSSTNGSGPTRMGSGIPEGPPVWICGDCHVGNLGPVADANGRVRIQIRDLDQTVIGNPAHDLVRLALSLASAARGSDLPGVTTAHMLEAMMDGYESALDHDFDEGKDNHEPPDAVRLVMKRAAKRTWKELARERIGDTRAKIPLGKRFWPVSDDELRELESIFKDRSIVRLATMVRSP